MKLSFIYLLIPTLMACERFQKTECDLVVHNATIYSVNEQFETFQAMAISNGRIVELGPEHHILNRYKAKEQYDAQTLPIYPGFIDAHCHFLGYGLNKQKIDLAGTGSFEEVLERTVVFANKYPEKEWLIGRGWDHNDWDEAKYPTNEKLDSLFPDRPVLLQRIDGHAALVNSAALKQAGIDEATYVEGGLLEQRNGKLTGILVDNAVDVYQQLFNDASEADKRTALLEAQKDLYRVGVTSVHDAGIDRGTIELIDRLNKEGSLTMRIYAMLSDKDENLAWAEEVGSIKTEQLNMRSIKVYADGALGSRGAFLLEPYADVDSNHYGLFLHTPEYLLAKARWAKEHGFQINTHCIGDSAARTVLDIYGNVLGGPGDERWRIEHAQIIHPDDLEKFRQFAVIPSVQPTHATSDMYWAEDRLGQERMSTAYAFRSLKEQLGWIPLGTDFPVEGIDPLRTFYAAVARKDPNGWPEGGFQTEEAISREDALRGMTIWAALAAFEENEKGSLEAGKMADFVVLDRDILKVGEQEILKTGTFATFSAGNQVH